MFYTILAIIIIAALVIIFVVTFILNRRTPRPEGCEDIVEYSKCKMCENTLCKKITLKEDD